MDEKKEYVKLWMSYKVYFEAYSAAEVGRLVLAMIEYKLSGAEPEFSGSERFIWPAIKRDIDMASAAQEAKAESNKENGKKGGRPKKSERLNDNPENPDGFSKTQNNPKNPVGFSETQKTLKDKDKDKVKVKDKVKDIVKDKNNKPPVSPLPPAGAELGFGEELAAVFDDWLQYKRERKDKPYTPTGLKSVITQIRNNTAKYGENAVAELIQECMAANYQGIIWERLEKRGNMSGKGYVTAQQAQAKNAGAHGPTREDLDRMKRLMATMKGEKEAEQ